MAQAATPIRDRSVERDRMVERQIAGRGIVDPRIFSAMRRVQREGFVAPGLEEFAYEDAPLPIDEAQTISQPYIVTLMIEAAQVKRGASAPSRRCRRSRAQAFRRPIRSGCEHRSNGPPAGTCTSSSVTFAALAAVPVKGCEQRQEAARFDIVGMRSSGAVSWTES
jgi:Protein-L-isoaspartate(D-aspartate) O-methyltransferase (PCMT)